MPLGLSLVSMIVKDYDDAIEFFVHKLGFRLLEDSPSTTSEGGRSKRWVVIQPPGPAGGCRILLAKADGARQEAALGGNQWAGRVGLFLEVEDFEQTYEKMRSNGVVFEGQPRVESYGKLVVWRDCEGNRWDLLGPAVR